MELRDPPRLEFLPEELPEAELCGAELLGTPNGCGDVVETGRTPPRPTATVLTVPGGGGVSALTRAVVDGVYRGTVNQVFQAPGCHIQPKPGTKAQLP